MMEIEKWLQHHWLDVILLPGNILMIEAIVRQAAVDRGYPKLVSWCDHLAKILGFLTDIITGLIKRKQQTGGNGK